MVEELVKALEEMKKSVQCMSTENNYQYSDGWRDGIEYVINKLEKTLKEEALN